MAGSSRWPGRPAAAGSGRPWSSACCGCCAARRRRTAIDAPRLNALPDLVRLEPGFAAEVVAALEPAGDQVAVAPGLDPYFGGVSAISPLGGGADPRRSGFVIMSDRRAVPVGEPAAGRAG